MKLPKLHIICSGSGARKVVSAVSAHTFAILQNQAWEASDGCLSPRCLLMGEA